jgi:nucleotide-binding universal stress UspA family protein
MSMSSLLAPIKIQLAVDGSEDSLAAARLIASLPMPTGSAVAVLAVHQGDASIELEHLAERLEETMAILHANGAIAAQHTELTGDPAQEIVRYSEEWKPQLIALGATGLHARMGFLLGGVAQKVIEDAHVAVLVARAATPHIKHLVIADDGSTCSDAAKEFVAGFPFPLGVRVTLLHVMQPQTTPGAVAPGFPVGTRFIPQWITMEDIAEAERRQVDSDERVGQRIISEARHVLRRTGLTVNGVLAYGDTASTIIDYAKGSNADLIVAGSRGFGAVKGWLLGSVSRVLVHDSECSVLIVKENQP